MNQDISKLSAAYCFSALKHAHQRRKGAGDIPYINHPVDVANLLASTIPDTDYNLLIAAILHDTLEDTKTSNAEIEELFGKEVLDIVLEVTDDMSLSKAIRKSKQIEKAPFISPKAKLIKIADKACNIRDILRTRMYWSNRQKVKYILWAVEVAEKCKNINTNLDQEFDEIVEKARSILKF